MKNSKLIDEGVRKQIEDANIWVLRTKTGVPLNVAYTSEGLLFTANKYGKLICYKDAVPSLEERNGKTFVVPKALSKGGLEPSKHVIIEKFIPRDHYIPGTDNLNNKLQGFEFRWINKAQRMLMDYNNPKDPAREVYKSSVQSGERFREKEEERVQVPDNKSKLPSK